MANLVDDRHEPQQTEQALLYRKLTMKCPVCYIWLDHVLLLNGSIDIRFTAFDIEPGLS